MNVSRIAGLFSCVLILIGPRAQAQSTRLMISEVQVGGIEEDIEFVELHNPTAEAINLSPRGINLRLHIRNAHGSSDVNKTLTFVRTTIPPFGYFLIASTAFNRLHPGMADATYSASSNSLLSDGSVYISTSGAAFNAVIDKVGWGAGGGERGSEGNPFPTAPPPGGSLKRKPEIKTSNAEPDLSGASRPGHRIDTNDNAADFEVRATSNPQNSRTEILNLVPALTAVAPDTGFMGQTTKLVLTGEHFVHGRTQVDFGPDILVDSVEFAGSGKLVVHLIVDRTTESGPRDVVVTNGPGISVRSPRAFVVAFPLPRLASVSPNIVSIGQSVTVDFFGDNFIEGRTEISLGAGITVNSFRVNGLNHATATVTVDHMALIGVREIVVRNPAPGGGMTTIPAGIMVGYPSAVLTNVEPAGGLRGARSKIRLRGEQFIEGVTTVSFGPEIEVLSLSRVSQNEAVVGIAVPFAAPAGAYDVSVTNPSPGGGTAVLSEGFLIENPAPVLSRITPSVGVQRGTVNLHITGNGFIDGVTSLSFGDHITINSLSVKPNTELNANITIGSGAALGPRNVTITNARPGGGTVTLTDAFRVEPEVQKDAEKEHASAPEVFALHEGYPNPFNPATTVRYALPERARVKLEIYNMLGNVVAAMVEGEKQKGYYEISWVADNQPSGVYLVRMQAEGLESQKRFIGSRKVVLVK